MVSERRNSGYRYRDRIGRESSGRTVLAFLAERYRHSSEADWRGRIEAGAVRVDGARVSPGTILTSGQMLVWQRPPWTEPEAPLSHTVFWKDEHVLAVAKPAGLPSVPGGGFLEHTLLSLVRRRHPEAVPMHRLGRWTSGVVVFARTRKARTEIARAWREGRVLRRYRALAVGHPDRREFEVEVPIGPVPHPILGTVHAASANGKRARTRVVVLEQRDRDFLADVAILTGRPHQIRIHLAAAGHPLAGDPLYAEGGLPAPGCSALPGDPGYSLHAARIRFPHPAGSAALDLHCPPPPALRPTVLRDWDDGRACGR